ncbi:MAG: branched-chain amino acid ABC transporter permease [Actinobacteria bacterium]|nr:branched-chain amino acid ABC transporter permease [Actinomycetota bacterium]
MPTTDTQQAPCPPPRARFARGLKLGLPIFLGYVPVGAAFGVVARSLGFNPLQAVACSATALAGAGQLIALQLIGSGATVLAVVVTTAIVNLRYVLFGAAMSPHVAGTPLPAQAFLAFTLTDETFAVNIDDHRQGSADARSMAGVGTIAWSGWVLGTAVGALAAGAIGDPTRFGVQFAMPAMFTALLVAQAEDRRHVIVGVAAAVTAIALMLALPDPWYLIVAPMITATAATAVSR